MSSAVEMFNPLAPEMAVDPYPFYRDLRESGSGVHHIPWLGMYVITRHADVSAFYLDRRLEMRYPERETGRYGPEVVDEPFFHYFQLMAFARDNPSHRTIRKMFSSSFTMRRLEALRPRIEQVADDLIDAQLPHGGMEFVADFADPFPRQIIGEVLGIPQSDNERIGELAITLGQAFEFLPMMPESVDAVNKSLGQLVEYLTWLADQRTAQPQDDLFSGMLAAARESDGEIDLDMVIANAVILYVGGQDTTSGAMELALLALHRQPEALQELRSDPSLVPAAVDELLRYDVSTQGTGRLAAEPVEYGGHTIEPGTMMLAYLGAALRDPAVYSDPDRIDFHRPPVKLISFGPGAHQCVGMVLARMELTAFLRNLATRMPEHRLGTLEPPFREFALLRGLASLDVSW